MSLAGMVPNILLVFQSGVAMGWLKLSGVGRSTLIPLFFNKLAKLIYPLPLSLEVTTNEKEEMIRQTKEFSSWSDNINVKITIHGPNGELENLEVIHKLENENNIKVNVTAMMSAQQCFIASLAGATYVSLFGGRINDMGYNSVDEIKKLRKLVPPQTKVISSSIIQLATVKSI